jgi:hypothetical protein
LPPLQEIRWREFAQRINAIFGKRFHAGKKKIEVTKNPQRQVGDSTTHMTVAGDGFVTGM